MQILRDNNLLAFEVCLIYFFMISLEILGRSVQFPVNPIMDFISSTDILCNLLANFYVQGIVNVFYQFTISVTLQKIFHGNQQG